MRSWSCCCRQVNVCNMVHCVPIPRCIREPGRVLGKTANTGLQYISDQYRVEYLNQEMRELQKHGKNVNKELHILCF
jgi:hypothetical protein